MIYNNTYVSYMNEEPLAMQLEWDPITRQDCDKFWPQDTHFDVFLEPSSSNVPFFCEASIFSVFQKIEEGSLGQVKLGI